MGLQRLGQFSFAIVTALALSSWPGSYISITASAREPGSNTRTIHVPHSSVVVALWEELDATGTSTPFYRISLDGQEISRESKATYQIGLGIGAFEPLEGEPTIPAQLTSNETGHLYIVQFVTPPLEQYADQIVALGGQVRHYIAQYAYLVEMDSRICASVGELPYVRWIGAYHPAYRLERFLLENLNEADQLYPRGTYNIQVHTPEQKQQVANRLSAGGARLRSSDAGKLLVRATLTPDELFAVAHWDEVLFIDRWGPYEQDMNIVRGMSGADSIEAAAGYAGSGVRGEVFDTGFNLDHHDFESRPLMEHGFTSEDDHGAGTSGICFGDGAGDSTARGLLPEGQGIVADHHYVGIDGNSRYHHSMQLVEEPYFAIFQTSSVGSPVTLDYTTVSADTDAMIFDSDLVHCQSQSNEGTQESRPEAWAKNMISSGGVYHYGTITFDDDCWCGGASIGPASDGCIKPTLCHVYDDIHTVDCCGYESYTGSFGGTSGSTPIVAGHVGLFHQMWAEGIFGNDVLPDTTVFANRPHMATAKAMMINTARQYAFTGLEHDMTRMHQGWGLPDVQNMYDRRQKFYVVDQAYQLEPFESRTQAVVVEPDEPALKITLCYLDPPGNPAVQDQHRINDLTLRVISPSDSIYWGNVGLLEGNWSTTGGEADTKNTVECVFVEYPEAGEWIVEVSADELVQDADPSSEELDATYALVVCGIQPLDYSDTDPTTEHRRSTLSLVLDGPNPSSRTTHFTYALSTAKSIRVTVHDIQGRRVATLFEGEQSAGTHRVTWDGLNPEGARVTPGVYFVRLTTQTQIVTEKLLRVK